MDFFTDSPLPGKDIYFVSLTVTSIFYRQLTVNCSSLQLRQIIHDWTFENCVKILKNVRPSLKPGSRVLISEYALFAV